MAESSLAKKLKLRSDMRAGVIYAPDGYVKELSPLPKGMELIEKLAGKFDWLQVFVKNKADLDKQIAKVVKALQAESLLWISFPKGSSKIQTDLTRDQGWDSVPEDALRWVTLVSVNDTWSAFSLRPYREGEEKQKSRFG